MTKATKKEKKGGSDTNKESFVVQKGISRSGRAIKPKKFGDMVTETIKQVAKNDEKVKELKKVTKVPKKVVTNNKTVTKKEPVVKKEKAPNKVVKKPKQNKEESDKPSSKASPIPEGFTPVDITAIISAKQQSNETTPKTVVAKVVAVSQANKVNNVTKTIVLSPIKKQMTYEDREKEIKLLRARLAKLEAEQEAERKARATAENPIKTPEKVVKIVKQQTTKTVVVPKKETSEVVKVVRQQPTTQKTVIVPTSNTTETTTVIKVVKQQQPVTKPTVAPKKETTETVDNRPARVKKPTWKAMEQD